MDDGREPGHPGSVRPAAEPAPEPAIEPGEPHWLRGRMRQVAMIVGFDLGGPLLIYSLLRAHGMGTVAALVLSGISPAAGIVIGAVADRRLDLIGVVVLAGLAVGTVAGLVSHNARLYLIEGAVPSLVFALACLLSLRSAKPLIYRFAVELLGPGTPKGREVIGAWRYPGFRRAFAVITAAWGVAYLIEVAIRLIVVVITSTGIALLVSKLLPYASAVLLSAWTVAYGEHEKNKAVRLAAATPGAPAPVPADAEP